MVQLTLPKNSRLVEGRTRMKLTLAWADGGAREVSIDYRPVHTRTMINDIRYIEPKAQVYR